MAKFKNPWAKGGKYYPTWLEETKNEVLDISDTNKASQLPDKSQKGVRNKFSLLFDGKNISVYDEDKVVYSTRATSGKGEHMNNPNSQDIQDFGPIPEGRYLLFNSEWKSQSTSIQLYNIFVHGSDWGDFNVPLHPVDYDGPRYGFYLHGGFKDGTSGCIDAGSFIKNIYKRIHNQNVTSLRVKYL